MHVPHSQKGQAEVAILVRERRLSINKDWFYRNAANLVSVFIGLGVFVAILTSALTAVCGGVITLPANETCAQCIRAWFGAASGWAAAIGALLAALLTLPHLRKQTAFIWGDAPPTLDVTEHLEEDDYLVVRIVNWNRRALFIENVEVTSASAKENYVDRVGFWQIKDNSGDRAGGFPMHLDGWEDRNSRPSFLRLDLVLLRA